MGALEVKDAHSYAMELITWPKSPFYGAAMHEIIDHFHTFDLVYDHVETTEQTLRIRDKTLENQVASLSALAERFGQEIYTSEFRQKWGMALLRAKTGHPTIADVAFIMQIGEVFGGSGNCSPTKGA